jgi:hypothetical protein
MIHEFRDTMPANRKVNVSCPKNKKPQWLSGKAHHGF